MKSALLFAILGLSGCAPTYSYAPFRPAPVTRQIPADAVEVFFTPPRCAFIELGMLETRATFSNMQEGLLNMREAAGARGADGIILIDHQETGGDHGSQTHSSRAIAISRDPSCAGDPASQYVGNGPARGYGAPGSPR